MSTQNETATAADVWVDVHTAQLCLDCERIFAGQHCPACSSANYMPLSRWIRPVEQAAPQEEALAPLEHPDAEPPSLLRAGVYLGLGILIGKMIFDRPRT